MSARCSRWERWPVAGAPLAWGGAALPGPVGDVCEDRTVSAGLEQGGEAAGRCPHASLEHQIVAGLAAASGLARAPLAWI